MRDSQLKLDKQSLHDRYTHGPSIFAVQTHLQHDDVWAHSAYSGQCFEDLLSLGGFESRIHEKGSRHHPLSEAAKERNSVKSAIRSCVEHVFGSMTMSMGGKLTRKIGIERAEAWWGLKNLTFNFLRYLQRSTKSLAIA